MKIEALKKIVNQIPANADITISFCTDELFAALFDLVRDGEEDNNCLSMYSQVFYKDSIKYENTTAVWNKSIIVLDKDVNRKG